MVRVTTDSLYKSLLDPVMLAINASVDQSVGTVALHLATIAGDCRG